MRILRHDQISQKSSVQNFTFDFVQFLTYPLVSMAPFLKENQQLPDADARCIGSQTAEQTLESSLYRGHS